MTIPLKRERPQTEYLRRRLGKRRVTEEGCIPAGPSSTISQAPVQVNVSVATAGSITSDQQRAIEELQEITGKRWTTINTAAFAENVVFSNYVICTNGDVYSLNCRRLMDHQDRGPFYVPRVKLTRDPNPRLDACHARSQHYGRNRNPKDCDFNNLVFAYNQDFSVLRDVSWTKAVHPSIPNSVDLWISRDGVLSKVFAATSIREITLPVTGYEITPHLRVTASNNLPLDIPIDEVVGCTFVLGYDHEQHYLFHRDGNLHNFSLSNIIHCRSIQEYGQAFVDYLKIKRPEYANYQFRHVSHTGYDASFDMYLVCDNGDMFSLFSLEKMKFTPRDGYNRVTLTDSKTGKQTTLSVSKMVWSSFHGRCVGPDMVIDHRNGDRTCDMLSNLEEVTRSINAYRANHDPIQVERRTRGERADEPWRAIKQPRPPTRHAKWKKISDLGCEKLQEYIGLDNYLVSSEGHVKNTITQELLRFFPASGYHVVHLTDAKSRNQQHGFGTVCFVHRLVALAFVEGFSESMIVHHLNGDKADN
ncbi:predicted protein [Lichtheimia corymbifera JMRC:FSU:9682]|uniref:HNH nuclease domain-containing protein n=1 Tax=Lichtheimia corymbifera JMRC:FSU:9682 TaxID=1263082 RepID=A0A068RNJ6_9FUNG|nr:predicted protein [Lichtheimia corymbifera JMRC:FSU:9682]